MTELQMLHKIDELKNTVKVLTNENAQLRFERDLARTDIKVLGHYATEEQEREMLESWKSAIPFNLEDFLAELESQVKQS